MNREQIIEEACDIIQEGAEFGTFWRDADPLSDFTLVCCDWIESDQEWIVRIRGLCPSPEIGDVWLFSMAFSATGELTGAIYDIEE